MNDFILQLECIDHKKSKLVQKKFYIGCRFYRVKSNDKKIEG